jgi:hypothetical protein
VQVRVCCTVFVENQVLRTSLERPSCSTMGLRSRKDRPTECPMGPKCPLGTSQLGTSYPTSYPQPLDARPGYPARPSIQPAATQPSVYPVSYLVGYPTSSYPSTQPATCIKPDRSLGQDHPSAARPDSSERTLAQISVPASAKHALRRRCAIHVLLIRPEPRPLPPPAPPGSRLLQPGALGPASSRAVCETDSDR